MDLNILKKRFTASRLFGFFLVSAFPFHLWKLIMLIRDYGWMTERAGVESFIGIAALAMLYALAESVLYFLLLLLLGLLIPWKWSADRVFSILGLVALWIPIWDILAQVYRAQDFSNPGFLVQWLFSTGHPLRYSYLLAALVVGAVVLLTAAAIWFVSFKPKLQKGLQEFLERLAILSALYLLLDIAALVILIFRLAGSS
jgi:hypothetical protein